MYSHNGDVFPIKVDRSLFRREFFVFQQSRYLKFRPAPALCQEFVNYQLQ